MDGSPFAGRRVQYTEKTPRDAKAEIAGAGQEGRGPAFFCPFQECDLSARFFSHADLAVKFPPNRLPSSGVQHGGQARRT